MSRKESLLMIFKVLRLSTNTLTVYDRYSLLSSDNSMQTFLMHLSQKQNIFSEFFSAFSKYALNFKHFLKKMTLIAYVFPKLRPPKDVLR